MLEFILGPELSCGHEPTHECEMRVTSRMTSSEEQYIDPRHVVMIAAKQRMVANTYAVAPAVLLQDASERTSARTENGSLWSNVVLAVGTIKRESAFASNVRGGIALAGSVSTSSQLRSCGVGDVIASIKDLDSMFMYVPSRGTQCSNVRCCKSLVGSRSQRAAHRALQGLRWCLARLAPLRWHWQSAVHVRATLEFPRAPFAVGLVLWRWCRKWRCTYHNEAVELLFS